MYVYPAEIHETSENKHSLQNILSILSNFINNPYYILNDNDE